MWLRYLSFSFLNILAEFFAIVLILAFVLPQTTPALVLQIVGWLIGVLCTILFSFLAFMKKNPDRRDAILLIVFHLSFFVLVYAGYGFLLSDRGAGIIVAPEFVVQMILEVLAVCLVAFHRRRRNLQSMLGEGRML
jgi:hypothetical protein